MNNKVYVTGVGVVSPIGIGTDVFWKNLIKGVSGIGKVTLFNTERFNRHNAGEVKQFVPSNHFHKRFVGFFGRASQFAIAGTEMALKDANIDLKNIERPAVIVGSTMVEARDTEYSSGKLYEQKIHDIKQRHIVSLYAPSIARNVGYYFGAQGVNLIIPCACAAGNYAIGYGYDLIRKGEIDLAIVGGADALSRVAFQGFQRLYSMAENICSPFDKNRKGMMLGEGAGILILESEKSVIKRKVRPYAEVLGYGLSCDAYHITIPHRQGIVKAMAKAIKNGKLDSKDVDYISAHGTGTVQNDKEESGAINELFGKRRVPVSSIKSMLGHCMGAASAIEAISCCLSIRNNIIPQTINYKNPDHECDIDCVPNKPRKVNVRVALNNGFAFGGNNCVVIFGK